MKITSIYSGAEPLQWLLEEHGRLEQELGPIEPKPAAVDIADDTLLTLKLAVGLPELQRAITVKGLRRAIRAGDLKASQPGGQNGVVYVTRTDIKTWISTWQRASRQDSGTDQHTTTPRPARSGRPESGSSSTDARRASLDAALKTARELSKR